MNILKIRLENFQSYLDKTIYFKPGLNLLVGSSDSGKSAILRAISFVIYNEPRGATLIHQGASEVRVTITFDNGIEVQRIKGQRNAVIVTGPDLAEPLIYDKIDTDLPEEVKKLLGNPPKDSFNGLISYADQFSKMFLVDLTPTDLPRSLSNLTGIEILEQAAKSLSQSYKSIEKQIKVDERELAKLNDEKNSFNQIVNFESKVKISKKRIDELKNNNNTLDDLKKIYNDSSFDIEEGSLEASVELLDEITSAQQNMTNLIKQSDSFSILKSFEILISGFIDESASDVLNKISSDIDAMKIKIENNKKTLLMQSALKNIQSEYDLIKTSGIKMSSELINLKKEISDLSNELAEYKVFLSDNNIQCEYCGNKLDV